MRQDRGRAEEIVEMQEVGEMLLLPGLQLEPLPAGQQELHYDWQHLVAFLPPIFFSSSQILVTERDVDLTLSTSPTAYRFI